MYQNDNAPGTELGDVKAQDSESGEAHTKTHEVYTKDPGQSALKTTTGADHNALTDTAQAGTGKQPTRKDKAPFLPESWPHPGMRIIKTVVAVYLCFLLDRWHGNAPLIAAFAAIICMQTSVRLTLQTGKERIFATLLGGLFGGGTLWVFQQLELSWSGYLFYFVVAFLLIPIIYLIVLTGHKEAVTLATIVYLVICFNHGQLVKPFELAFNRTASTLLGIVIAGLVNYVLPGQKSEIRTGRQDDTTK